MENIYDIFVEGRIYLDVTELDLPHPTESEDEHEYVQLQCNHIANFPFLQVVGNHKFENMQTVVKGQDYSTTNVCNSPNCHCYEGTPKYCRYNSQGKKVAIYIKKR